MIALLIMYGIGVMLAFVFFTGTSHDAPLLSIFGFSLLWPGVLLFVIGFIILNSLGIIK